MKLVLRNIGKIRSASIEINGITVIAGENNTGKSTISRALFAVLNTFCDYQSRVLKERIASVENILNRMFFHPIARGVLSVSKHELAVAIVSQFDNNKQNESSNLKKIISDLILQYDGINADSFDKSIFDDAVNQINGALTISDEVILEFLLNRKLHSEFNEQVCNIFSEEDGEIQLQIKKDNIKVLIENEATVQIENSNNISLQSEAIYIDDPFVLDDFRLHFVTDSSLAAEHRFDLSSKLFGLSHKENSVDAIVTQDKLKNIYEKIDSVCSGDVVASNRFMMGFRRKGSDKILNVRNLSTGLKTFVILKILLTRGIIKQNGAIILDEPEIHLHPEWQLLFAELIVLIQKEFGLHVLLNTHSPYFLRAIQVYSAKYEIADICKYYLSNVLDNQSVITDVSEHIESIYEKLSHPLQKLENERWEDD